MENSQENGAFHYTYSAQEQEEVQKIRQKYMPKEADKMDHLRKLDQGVTKKGTVISLVVGIIGTLILGVGMCCTLVWAESLFIPGIVIGLAGIAVVAAAYPLHLHITKKERERIAPEILRLTDELLK